MMATEEVRNWRCSDCARVFANGNQARSRVTHGLDAPEDIDDELLGWVRRAYDLTG